MERALLRGATAARFLARYWQQRPLLIRRAVDGFRGLLSWRESTDLATRDDVESRLVVRERGGWTLVHGPFRRSDFRALPERNWTLLIQGVNLHVPAADALLRRFSFVPYARLDDLMVSYAAPGGGVGPHFDSYDVFLLQGKGQRRWRLSRQHDLALKRDVPLKSLARFRPDHEVLLDPGDMLYLPPGIAHVPAARAPARIARGLSDYAASALSGLVWDDRTIACFLGAYLTEPKPAVTFTPPRPPLARRVFTARAARRGVRLDSRTQLLYDARNLFINGDVLDRPTIGWPAIRRLANTRQLAADDVDAGVANLLYPWYRDGFVHLD